MTSVAISRIAAVGLIGLVALLAAPVIHGQKAVVEPPTIDPPARVARLSLIDGEVSFAPAGTEEWAEAVLNRPITSEDRLSVGADARAELQVGSATIHLDRDTGFGFIELDDEVMQMSLTDGAATVRVRRLAERETIQVETPNATVRLLHTGEYHFEVDPESDRTIVKTRSGEAEVVGGSRTYRVRANEQGEFSGLDDLTAQIGPIASRTPFEAWANDRDRREERAESSRYVSRDVVGYEDLDDNGEWIHEREYGYVWRPTYVAADWAPYRFGRWAWVSPWGWTWIDDARWGFAPFHYGRWAHLRNRWCWVPGPRHLRPVYAPALVGWIGGPSVSVSVSFGSGIGWFPLGPREVYLPGYRHTPRYIRHVNVSNTIIINNTYITNAYNRRGPHQDYRHRHHPDAITAVQRDHFVGGRPIAGHRVRLNEGDLRQWRDDPHPPAIAPYRESVLAGQPRERRHDRTGANSREWLARRGGAGRVNFTEERRAIENNGGRPISRSQLIDNPKERGDFRVARPGGRDIKRRQAASSQRNELSGGAPLIDRSAPRGEVRADQRSQRNRGGGERVGNERGERERIESMRAESEARSESRRSAGARLVTPERTQREWRQTPAPQRLQAAPERREERARHNDRPQYNRERSSERTMRDAPRREATPAPAPQNVAPAPQSRQREHGAPSSQSQPARGRSSGSSRDRGNSRRQQP